MSDKPKERLEAASRTVPVGRHSHWRKKTQPHVMGHSLGIPSKKAWEDEILENSTDGNQLTSHGLHTGLVPRLAVL